MKDFSLISGLQVKYLKSDMIYPPNLDRLKEQKVKEQFPYTCHQLWIQIPLDLTKIFRGYFGKIYQQSSKYLKDWHKKIYSWFDRLYLVKSFILLKFMFLFWAFPITVYERTVAK